jgi:hypothetical protein
MCILRYLEFLTRFALTFHSLSGEDFCASGKAFLEHQNRHGFKALAVDVLASITLNFGSLVLAAAITAITCVSASSVLPDGDSYKVLILVLLGLVSFLLAYALLFFIAAILLNIIDASYACLVLDLDSAQQTGTYCQPAMAQAILAKAKPDFVLVQTPGGAYVAQPTQQATGAQQVSIDMQGRAQVTPTPAVVQVQPVVHAVGATPVAMPVAQPVAQQMTVQATVPGGETMVVDVNGQQLAVQVPPGVVPGQTFTFQLGG